MTGTIINVLAVAGGGMLGLVLGDRIPARVRSTLLHAIGVFTLLLGADMSLGSQSPITVLLSLVLGGATGEALRLEERLRAWSERGEAWLASRARSAAGSDIGRGLITASLVFCAGPMTILGSLQDGLTGDYTTLAVKSVMDGVTSMAFASALGAGVPAAAAVVLLVQGSLSLSAAALKPLLTAGVVAEVSATGGALIVAIGLGILNVVQIKTVNLLPALAFAPLLSHLLPLP